MSKSRENCSRRLLYTSPPGGTYGPPSPPGGTCDKPTVRMPWLIVLFANLSTVGGGERQTGQRQGGVRVRRHLRGPRQPRLLGSGLRSAADAPLRHDGTEGQLQHFIPFNLKSSPPGGTCELIVYEEIAFVVTGWCSILGWYQLDPTPPRHPPWRPAEAGAPPTCDIIHIGAHPFFKQKLIHSTISFFN